MYILWPVYHSRTLRYAVVQAPPTALAARLTVMAGPQDPLPPAPSALPKSPMTGTGSIRSQGVCSPATPKKMWVKFSEMISFVPSPVVLLTLLLLSVTSTWSPAGTRMSAEKLTSWKRRRGGRRGSSQPERTHQSQSFSTPSPSVAKQSKRSPRTKSAFLSTRNASPAPSPARRSPARSSRTGTAKISKKAW